MNAKKNSGSNILIFGIPIALTIIIGLWLLNLYYIQAQGDSERGTFGDMFGAVNALFSGLAFAGLIITILLQRKDLQAQHHSLETQIEELKVSNIALQAQQQELKETREVFLEQSKTQKIQQFENTFFNMLELHQKRVDSFSTVSDNYFSKIINELDGRSTFNNVNSINSAYKHLTDNYIKTYNAKHKTNLAFYFRSLYRIFKLISKLDNEEESWFYSKIVRAQMSDEEQLVLYLNASTELGEKFQKQILMYNLLKHASSNAFSTVFAYNIKKKDLISTSEIAYIGIYERFQISLQKFLRLILRTIPELINYETSTPGMFAHENLLFNQDQRNNCYINITTHPIFETVTKDKLYLIENLAKDAIYELLVYRSFKKYYTQGDIEIETKWIGKLDHTDYPVGTLAIQFKHKNNIKLKYTRDKF